MQTVMPYTLLILFHCILLLPADYTADTSALDGMLVGLIGGDMPASIIPIAFSQAFI
jgi:hypothetical protein